MFFLMQKDNLKHLLKKCNSSQQVWKPGAIAEFYKKANIKALISLSSKMIETPKSLKYIIAFKRITYKAVSFFKLYFMYPKSYENRALH